ncbi:MAG: hypothetical protein AAGB31_04140 [Bdellovibrio sp.]
MNKLSILFVALGLMIMGNQSLAHPKGTDSVLDQNIVSIDLKNDVNIPPNTKQVELVRLGGSVCVLNMVEGAGYDRSLKASNLNVISVKAYTLETPGKDNYRYSNFQDDYVVFKIASKKNPRQAHPVIADILCGFDVTQGGRPLIILTRDGWQTNSYKRFAMPSFDELKSFASKMLRFQLGETLDITNQ